MQNGIFLGCFCGYFPIDFYILWGIYPIECKNGLSMEQKAILELFID